MSGSRILELVEKHERIRAEGLPLIASETRPTRDAMRCLASDLAGRYHAPWYGGTSTAREIIGATEELAKRLFGAKYAIVTPLSGNVCDLSAVFALSEPGDRVGMVHFENGGYPLGLGKFHRQAVYLPVDPETYCMDPKRVKEVISDQGVRLTILGASFLLFPQPVGEVSGHVKALGGEARCVFDGSHVMGLIATGAYPNPLAEGAEVLFGSTHKTLCGPQGGLVVTNDRELYDRFWQVLDIDLDTGIGLVDNPHVNRVAAVGASLEWLEANGDFGGRVIENSKALARALDGEGVPLKFKERDFTETHQVLMDISHGRAEEFCRQMDANGMYIDVEGRVGTAEVTARGFGPDEMRKIGGLMAEVFRNGGGDGVREEVRRLAGALGER